MTDLASLTIHELAPKLRKKEISSVELTHSVLKRIDRLDAKIGAFITVCADKALAQAKAVDSQIAKNQYPGPLMGIPLAPKDIYLTEGIKTTCASKILENYIPPYNSTVIQKFLDAQAVIVGKV